MISFGNIPDASTARHARRVRLDLSVSLQHLSFVFHVCGLMLGEDGSCLWMAQAGHVELQRRFADVSNAAAACDDSLVGRGPGGQVRRAHTMGNEADLPGCSTLG